MRRHGWHLPFHKLQIFAIVSFCFLFASFYLFSAPFLGEQEVISTVTVLYTSLALAVFGLYIRCAAINPEDTGISIHIPIKPFTNMDAITISHEKLDTIQDSILKLEALHSLAVQSHQNANKSARSKVQKILKLPVLCLSKADNCTRDDTTSLETMANSLNCVLCNRRVSTCSKHCKSCDKCVYGFDHHCKWINNCVGKKNYSTFLALLAVTVCLLLLEVIAGIVVIVRCSTHAKGFNDRIYEKLGSSFSKGLVATIVAISSSISLVALAAVAELLLFHIVLIKKGLTTYGYVVAARTLNELQSLSDYENSHSHLPVSPVSSLLSSRSMGSSAFGAHYRRTWCTPPRIYLDSDDQDEVAPQLPPTVDVDSTPSTTSMAADRYIKPRHQKVRISPWRLARLDMDEVARLVLSKNRTAPGPNQGQPSSSLPVFGQAMSWPQRSSSNSNTNTHSYSSTNAIESSAKSSADGEDDEQFLPMPHPQSRAVEGMLWSSNSHRPCPSAHHTAQSFETREMPSSAKAPSHHHCQNLSRVCPLRSNSSSMSNALHQQCEPSQQRIVTRWGAKKVPLMRQSDMVSAEDRSMPWSDIITDHDSNGGHQKTELSPPHSDDGFMQSPTLRRGDTQSSSPGSASKALLTTRSVNEEDNIIIPSSKGRVYCRSLNFEQCSRSVQIDGASIFFGGPLSCPSTPPSVPSDTDL